MIFIDWIRNEQSKIIGFKYFSSNLSGTHGVGYGSGKFSDSTPNGRGILRNSMRIARVGAIKDYAKFDRVAIPDLRFLRKRAASNRKFSSLEMDVIPLVDQEGDRA